MIKYKILKVFPVSINESFVKAKEAFDSKAECLGLFNNENEITHYILKEDFLKVQKFNLEDYKLSLIATLAEVVDLNVNNLNEEIISKYQGKCLRKAVFIGKSHKNIKKLLVFNDEKKEEHNLNLRHHYEKNISPEIRKCLKLCSIAANESSTQIFLIGGIVRDIILNRLNFDVDITVQGNAIEFVRFLSEKYPDICHIKETHDAFKTAKVVFRTDNGKINIDFASTRKESYPYPGSLPEVGEIGCEMYDDVTRRDFTINSMALSLNKSNFCDLIDYLNGYEDLQNGLIEIIHPVSFVDDPTRIIRALKFSSRFNFKLSEPTKFLQSTCLSSGLFDSLAGERIKLELKDTLNLNKAECLQRLFSENIFKLINKDIPISSSYKKLCENCKKTILKYSAFIKDKSFIWLIYLGAILLEFSEESLREIADSLYLSGSEEKIILESKDLFSKKDELLKSKTPFEIYDNLENIPDESIITCLIKLPELEDKIDLYFNKLKNIDIVSNGKTLIDLGLAPGPVFGTILQELLKARLNGIITSKEDEITYIKKLLEEKKFNSLL